MGDVLRKVFTIASALSLLLCVATVVLWVRSYRGGDKFTRSVIRHWPNGVYDPDDDLYLGVEASETAQSITFDMGDVTASFWQFHIELTRNDFLSVSKDESAGVHYAWDDVDLIIWPLHVPTETQVTFPIWPIAVAFAVMPLMTILL